MLIRAVTIRGTVDERELKLYRTVKVVQKLAPTVEYCRLVFVRAEHIVNIRKTNSLRIRPITSPADSVREHSLKRDGVLRREILGLTFCEIYKAIPPFRILPAS